MMMVFDFGPFVGMLLNQLPYYLVWLVGLILAIVYWSRYPRPALLTTLAVGTMFLASVVYSFYWSKMSFQWADGVPDRTGIQAITWGYNIVRALGYGLLFWAIFSGRQAFAARRLDRRRDEEDDLDEVERTGDPDTGIRKQPKRMGD